MSIATTLALVTANILGSFNNPFEFDGDYGDQMNPTRQYVFEQVVQKEAIARHMTDDQIIATLVNDIATKEEIEARREELIIGAISHDKIHGPSLGELVTPAFIAEIYAIQKELDDFTRDDLEQIISFVSRFNDQKIFRFLHHTPRALLHYDYTLAKEARAGRPSNLPVITNPTHLTGTDSHSLRKTLLHAVFTKELLSLSKSQQSVQKAVDSFDETFLKDLLGENATPEDLYALTSPAGQVFTYWLYESMNLDLISKDKAMIAEVNKVKDIFGKTLGNPRSRAINFKATLLENDTDVVFTQESDLVVADVLIEDGTFHPLKDQDTSDGTFVFLRADKWLPGYETIDLPQYDDKNKVNMVLAQTIDGESFLLAAAHGASTDASDGRLQITLIKDAFLKIKKERGLDDLQLVIGADANTKSHDDVIAFHENLERLGLVGTSLGPTTIKRRMVSIQHSKVGKYCIDEEDFLITLKGKYELTNQKVGFGNEVDQTRVIPDVGNPSDHFAVSATLKAKPLPTE